MSIKLNDKIPCYMCGLWFDKTILYEYRENVFLCRNCFLSTGGGEPPRTPTEPIKQQTTNKER